MTNLPKKNPIQGSGVSGKGLPPSSKSGIPRKPVSGGKPAASPEDGEKHVGSGPGLPKAKPISTPGASLGSSIPSKGGMSPSKPSIPPSKPEAPGKNVPSGQSEKVEDVGEKTLIGEEIDKEKAQLSAEMAASQPTETAILKIVYGGAVSNYRLKKEKIVTFIGSQREECDIVINDPAVANKQLAIIYYDGVYILADCGIHDLATFDGVATRQIVCPPGSKCVINMNLTSILFEYPGENKGLGEKRFHLEPEDFGPPPPQASFIVEWEGAKYTSTRDPLLIGSHRDCNIVLVSPTIKPFHAMIHWDEKGVSISKISNGSIKVNNTEIEKKYQLQTNDEIEIGDKKLKILLDGDIEGKVNSLFGGYKLNFNYIRFSAIPGSVCRSFMMPAIGGAIMVGRSPHADVTLEDGAVSREHAQLIPNGKTCQLIDNYSSNGCFVNNERVTKARLRAGDIVEIGRSIFVVHYD